MDYNIKAENVYLTVELFSFGEERRGTIDYIKDICRELGCEYTKLTYKHIKNPWIEYTENNIAADSFDNLYPKIVAKFDSSNNTNFSKHLIANHLEKIVKLEKVLQEV